MKTLFHENLVFTVRIDAFLTRAPIVHGFGFDFAGVIIETRFFFVIEQNNINNAQTSDVNNGFIHAR